MEARKLHRRKENTMELILRPITPEINRKKACNMLRPSVFTRNNLFDDFFNDDFFAPTPARHANGGAAIMHTDIRETDTDYIIDMELPGFKKEDVEAELKDGYLTVRAEHNTENDEKNKEGHYIRKERYYGNFARSFYVGEAVTQDDIKAAYKDGILTLDVPKKEKEEKVEEKKLISIEG